MSCIVNKAMPIHINHALPPPPPPPPPETMGLKHHVQHLAAHTHTFTEEEIELLMDNESTHDANLISMGL